MTEEKQSTIAAAAGRVLTTAARRIDAISSKITGLGTGRDKAQSYSIAQPAMMSYEQLGWLYQDVSLAQRIVMRPVRDMFREGFTVSVKDVDDELEQLSAGEEIITALTDLGLLDALEDAVRVLRTYGGALIWMVVDDGMDPSEPLDLSRINRVASAQVIEPERIKVAERDKDMLSPRFNKALKFAVTSEDRQGFSTRIDTAIIHASRCIELHGIPTPPQALQHASVRSESGLRAAARSDYFGLGALDAAAWEIMAHRMGWLGARNLMADNAQGILRIKGLADALLTEGMQQVVMDRATCIDYERSSARSIVLDSDEDFTRIQSSLTGLPEFIRELSVAAAGAAEIPMTLLFGISPAGLNATGDSDIRLYYDAIAAYQAKDLRRKIDRMIEIVTASSDGPTSGKVPQDWEVKFKPLYQMSDIELADIRLKQAQTDSIYEEMQALTADEIALSRFRRTGWSAETSVDMVARAAAAEDKAAAEVASISLAPTDVAKVITVGEARASQGLGPLGDDRDNLTVEAFAALATAGPETQGASTPEQPDGGASVPPAGETPNG